MIKDSDEMIRRFKPEKPTAVTTKIDKVIDQKNIENTLAAMSLANKKKLI